MPEVLVRKLDEAAIQALKRQAKQHGRSLQAELKAIIEDAARHAQFDPAKELARVRSLFKGRRFSDSAGLIREDRDR